MRGVKIQPVEVILEWGIQAINAYADQVDTIIVVDILSFSTAVSVALERGAVVIPYPFEYTTASAFAQAKNAILAVHRGETTADKPYSLSPQSFQKAQYGDKIVLPSPNGATCCVRAHENGVRNVLIGSLRNAQATAAAANSNGERILIAPCGERWTDGSLRPAIEDLLGAGAIAAALETTARLSPEAFLAACFFRQASDRLGNLIRRCASGHELLEMGYGGDIDMAVDLDATTVSGKMTNGEIVILTES